MATGWAAEGAVQEQIDATVKDGIERAKSRLSQGPSLTHCADCGNSIPEARQKAVIGNAPVKVAIEAAVRWGWDAVIGHDGIFIGMHSFGESGPAKDLYKHFGITAEAAVNAVLKRLG